MEFVLHERLNREQHVAVCIVEQIERREDNQRSLRLKIVLRHASSDYTMSNLELQIVTKTRNHKGHEGKLDWNSFVIFRVLGGYDFAGLGHFAKMVVEIPPRGRNSPRTSAHTGFAHFTTSSST